MGSFMLLFSYEEYTPEKNIYEAVFFSLYSFFFLIENEMLLRN